MVDDKESRAKIRESVLVLILVLGIFVEFLGRSVAAVVPSTWHPLWLVMEIVDSVAAEGTTKRQAPE
jgi:hypothetical protein